MAAQKRVELFSGRVKKVSPKHVNTVGLGTGQERYEYIRLSETEPNLYTPWRSVNALNVEIEADPTDSEHVNLAKVTYFDDQLQLDITPKYPSNYADPAKAGQPNTTLRAIALSDRDGNRSWTEKVAFDVNDNLILNTNLFVNGTTVQVNTSSVTIDDPILTVGGDVPATAQLVDYDAGVAFRWWDAAADAAEAGQGAKTGFFGFQNETQRFVFIPRGQQIGKKFVGDVSGTLGAALQLQDLIVERVYSPDNKNLQLFAGANGTVQILSAITEGTWNADVIDVSYGGTGRPELTSKGVVFGNGSDPVGVTNAAYANGSVLQADLGGNPYFSNVIDCGSF
jgi:hypothetical protein